MLKETETEKTLRFVNIIFIFGGISRGGGSDFAPLSGYALDEVGL